jgi:ATPase subunit of ABC transporter with duplicated ATPase domains
MSSGKLVAVSAAQWICWSAFLPPMIGDGRCWAELAETPHSLTGHAVSGCAATTRHHRLECAMSTSIVCSDLSFTWPDGRTVFDGLDLVISSGRTGLIGANGSGKSTLLRLAAGELTPTRGSVTTMGSLGYLPQQITLQAGLPVEQVLGIAQARAALAAIEAGDASAEHLAALGEQWDVEERARATLDRLGLHRVTLDRRVGELSSGEAVLLALAAQLLRRPDVLLLDEPTNNLDLHARQALYDVVVAWRGVLVVVSHDRELLELADATVELYRGRARWYGGNLTAYEEALALSRMRCGARSAPLRLTYASSAAS